MFIIKINLLIALSEKSVFVETDTKRVNIFPLCFKMQIFLVLFLMIDKAVIIILQQKKPVRLTRPRSCSYKRPNTTFV